MSFSNFANFFISSSICSSAFFFSFSQASSAATWMSVERQDRTNRECIRTLNSQKAKAPAWWRRANVHTCVVRLYSRVCKYHVNNRELRHLSNHTRCNTPTRNAHLLSQIIKLRSQINTHASGVFSISVNTHASQRFLFRNISAYSSMLLRNTHRDSCRIVRK